MESKFLVVDADSTMNSGRNNVGLDRPSSIASAAGLSSGAIGGIFEGSDVRLSTVVKLSVAVESHPFGVIKASGFPVSWGDWRNINESMSLEDIVAIVRRSVSLGKAKELADALYSMAEADGKFDNIVNNERGLSPVPISDNPSAGSTRKPA